MKKGFSLIEMLVVVGVVAVTAAILMPVFMHHRGSSRISCQNNLK